MSQDSMTGSTIINRAKKYISCASKISSPSVSVQDSRISKTSRRSDNDFHPDDLDHAFSPKLGFERYRAIASITMRQIDTALMKIITKD
jgi:hypothetical protein